MMRLWEFNRIDWSAFEVAPQNDVSTVPQALTELLNADDSEKANDAYWNIDNVVVVQGRAYSAAVPTAACAVQMLACHLHVEAREKVLELLEQLAKAGTPDDDLVLLENIRAEIRRGFPSYAVLSQIGRRLEREFCTELLIICAKGDPLLLQRVRYYIRRITEDPAVAAETRQYVTERLTWSL